MLLAPQVKTHVHLKGVYAFAVLAEPCCASHFAVSADLAHALTEASAFGQNTQGILHESLMLHGGSDHLKRQWDFAHCNARRAGMACGH